MKFFIVGALLFVAVAQVLGGESEFEFIYMHFYEIQTGIALSLFLKKCISCMFNCISSKSRNQTRIVNTFQLAKRVVAIKAFMDEVIS